MFDGRFDQHFAEFFANAQAQDARKSPQGPAGAALFAVVLGVISVVCIWVTL